MQMFKIILRNSLNYALILSAVYVVYQLIIYIFSINDLSLTWSFFNMIFNIVVIGLVIIYAAKNLKNKYLDGNISFSKCLVSGLLTGVIAAVIISLYYFFFYKFFDPEELTRKSNDMIKMISDYLNNQGLPEEEINKEIHRIKEGFKLYNVVKNTLITFTIFSSVITLLSFLFLRKKNVD